MYKGWKKLTPEEREHLENVANVKTTVELEDTFRFQAEQRAKFPKSSEPCWDCRLIAKKLGYPLGIQDLTR